MLVDAAIFRFDTGAFLEQSGGNLNETTGFCFVDVIDPPCTLGATSRVKESPQTVSAG